MLSANVSNIWSVIYFAVTLAMCVYCFALYFRVFTNELSVCRWNKWKENEELVLWVVLYSLSADVARSVSGTCQETSAERRNNVVFSTCGLVSSW